MDRIRFIGSEDVTYDVSLNFSGNIAHILFYGDIPQNMTGGFQVLNEHNNKVMGSYDSYITLYRSNGNVVELSDDGSVYDPLYTVYFRANYGGTITNGEAQVVNDYREIVAPTIVPSENYVFSNWSPILPESGVVEKDMVFTAEFEYVRPLSEIKSEKIEQMSLSCENAICDGVDIKIGDEVKHFSYKKPEDQSNIKELFDMAVSTNLPVYYHADGESCMLYTVEQMIAIYAGNAFNKNNNETYFNQLKLHILNDVDDRKTAEAIAYGSALPEDRQAVVDASAANATLILQTQLTGASVNFENVVSMINFATNKDNAEE